MTHCSNTSTTCERPLQQQLQWVQQLPLCCADRSCRGTAVLLLCRPYTRNVSIRFCASVCARVHACISTHRHLGLRLPLGVRSIPRQLRFTPVAAAEPAGEALQRQWLRYWWLRVVRLTPLALAAAAAAGAAARCGHNRRRSSSSSSCCCCSGSLRLLSRSIRTSSGAPRRLLLRTDVLQLPHCHLYFDSSPQQMREPKGVLTGIQCCSFIC